MSTLPADAVSAAARFVLLRDLPLLVVDLEPPAVSSDAKAGAARMRQPWPSMPVSP